MADKRAGSEEGLLFYLSGENGKTADFAMGDREPTFFSLVDIVDGGVDGKKAFQCADKQLMAYKAPGNIYAERGTISFFWRSRYPVGMTPFPIFRVATSDSSSWDHVFIRIDYNGQQQGIDAFVTDANLSRTRVSSAMHPFPKENEWLHIAFSWDENVGVKLYLNGYLEEQKLEQNVYFSGLDQFGPHSRNISSWSVQSAYNYVRGGDIDEIRIYDRMLSDDNIYELYQNLPLTGVPKADRTMDCPEARAEFLKRYGWDREFLQPKYEEGDLSVRKVEISDAYDLKRWWYKSTDGIRETSWPGVFNRSRLSGRNDYFQLPDWDCYYNSGKAITYYMPEEDWNHIEISGSAFGKMVLVDGKKEQELSNRVRYQERSVHRFEKAIRGKAVRFENTLIEEPIGDFSVYNVKKGKAPKNAKRIERFYIDANPKKDLTENEQAVADFVNGRYLPDERNLCFGVKEAVPFAGTPEKALPFVNLAIHYDNAAHDGLDGVGIEFPAMALADTENGLMKMNVQIKDPLWKYRNLANFTFCLKAGEAKAVWFDLRDRIIPEDRALYITFACSAGDFTKASLQGAAVSLYYKPQKEALKEHVMDRTNQIRDNYCNMLEEHPCRPQLNMWNRFIQDCIDILKYDPENDIARKFMWDSKVETAGHVRTTGSPDVLEAETEGSYRGFPIVKPEYHQAQPPKGVEAWAFYQVEMIRRFKTVTDWWISDRMIENGELGGGLSDDGDQMQTYIALDRLGFEREKYHRAHATQMEAYYDQGMFVDGLAMIQTDALHSYEDGIQMLTQSTAYEPWNPLHFERALETTRGCYRVTEFNRYGERLFITSMFSGSRIGREAPWNGSNNASYLICGPALNIARYSGNTKAKQLIIELADSLVNHFYDGQNHPHINFDTGEDEHENDRFFTNIPLAAYYFTGEQKYLDLLRAPGSEKAFALTYREEADTFDKEALAKANAAAEEKMYYREYINTVGHTWSDRLKINIDDAQIQRFGGLMMDRNYQYPLNLITWKFCNEQDAFNVGIKVLSAKQTGFRVVVFNMADHAVKAEMEGYDVAPGTWEIVTGLDTDRDEYIDRQLSKEERYFENFETVELSFAPKATTVVELKLKTPGKPYHERPDLAIMKNDAVWDDEKIRVVVHSMGSVDAPETEVALYDPSGKEIARAKIPALPAPNDLFPKTVGVTFRLSGDKKGCRIVIDPDNRLYEITRKNNEIILN